MTDKIYGLYDPRERPTRIRYVGYTSNTLANRLAAHIKEAKYKKNVNTHRLHWLRKLAAEGVRPEIILLERVEGEWQARERHWIAALAADVNSTAGGEGLIAPTADVRARISARVAEGLMGNQRRKGVLHTDADKAKISEALLNSDKFKAANTAKRGRTRNLTPEALACMQAKLSKAKTGVKRAPFTAEAKKNMSEAQIGRKHTEESKNKIGVAHKGNKWALGRKRSDEECEAIRIYRVGSKIITDGKARKLLKAGAPLPEGWHYVRAK
jgi:hypothetical protein